MPDQREQIEQEVRDIISEKGFDGHTAKPDDHLYDELGMDSLDRVELVMEIEKKFNLSIDDSDSEEFKNIQNVVDYLGERIQHRV